ncbi:hypothetical protein HK097_011566 [Rhizophlyctis rosea]|uniref:Uncharacterized protein n=1 Tax=Rhizophlyctis rosea TaxID=64517 RepID=A0AAD5X7R2_9FUNG|nr:hypothetical protein HK097_011566 [Rhizophlyctis rosea]
MARGRRRNPTLANHQRREVDYVPRPPRTATPYTLIPPPRRIIPPTTAAFKAPVVLHRHLPDELLIVIFRLALFGPPGTIAVTSNSRMISLIDAMTIHSIVHELVQSEITKRPLHFAKSLKAFQKVAIPVQCWLSVINVTSPTASIATAALQGMYSNAYNSMLRGQGWLASKSDIQDCAVIVETSMFPNEAYYIRGNLNQELTWGRNQRPFAGVLGNILVIATTRLALHTYGCSHWLSLSNWSSVHTDCTGVLNYIDGLDYVNMTALKPLRLSDVHNEPAGQILWVQGQQHHYHPNIDPHKKVQVWTEFGLMGDVDAKDFIENGATLQQRKWSRSKILEWCLNDVPDGGLIKDFSHMALLENLQVIKITGRTSAQLLTAFHTAFLHLHTLDISQTTSITTTLASSIQQSCAHLEALVVNRIEMVQVSHTDHALRLIAAKNSLKQLAFSEAKSEGNKAAAAAIVLALKGRATAVEFDGSVTKLKF